MNEPAKEISLFVGQKIQFLSHAQESTVKSTLAQLRRGIGKHPGGTPQIWNLTLENLPDSLLSKDSQGSPTIGEWAAHITLTLFALHQQGHDIRAELMSRDEGKFGKAVRKLVENDDDLPRIKRRFDATVTSDNVEEISHHLRGLVQLLKANSIPLDYPGLAHDLYWFQIQKTRDNIRLKWGQDFYRYQKEEG